MKYQRKHKSLLLGITGLSLASVVPLVVACGDNPVDVAPSKQENVFAKEVFLESFFDSKALEELLIASNQNSEDITAQEIVTLAQKKPLYIALDDRTKTLINTDLGNIALTKNAQDNQVVSLETTSGNNQTVKFEHELVKLSQEIYQFDGQKKEVTIDASKLTSINDIFKAIDDVWNIRPEYNNFTQAKHSNLYNIITDSDYFSLGQQTKNMSIFQNFLGWNFDYKIIFNFADSIFTLDNTSLLANLNALEKAIKENISDESLYNHFGELDPITATKLDQWMATQDYPNYELYNVLSRELNTSSTFKYEDQGNIFNKFIFSNFASFPSTMPLSAYKNVNNILTEIFHNFAQFTASDIFSQIIQQPTFNKNFFYYSSWSKRTGSLVKTNILATDLLAKPAFLDDLLSSLNLEAQGSKVHYLKDISNLEYMFAQYVFATDQLADFKKIDYGLRSDSYNKLMIDNLEIKYDENQIPYIEQKEFKEFFVPRQRLVKTKQLDLIETNDIPLNDIFETKVYWIPKSDYYIYKEEDGQDDYFNLQAILAFQKTENNQFNFYENYTPRKIVKDQSFDFYLQGEYIDKNFYNPKNLAIGFKAEDLFDLHLNDSTLVSIDNLDWEFENDVLDQLAAIYNKLPNPSILGSDKISLSSVDLKVKMKVNLNEKAAQDINLEKTTSINNVEFEKLTRTTSFEFDLNLYITFYAEDNVWTSAHTMYAKL